MWKVFLHTQNAICLWHRISTLDKNETEWSDFEYVFGSIKEAANKKKIARQKREKSKVSI
jgi:hypothetical protein